MARFWFLLVTVTKRKQVGLQGTHVEDGKSQEQSFPKICLCLFPTHWGGQEPNFNKCQLAKSDGSEEPTAFPLFESYFSSLNAQAPACIASSASTPLLFSHYGMSNSL